MIYAVFIFSLFIFIGGVFYFSRRLGRLEEKQKHIESLLKTTVKAQSIRNRLRRDSSYAQRVREAFKR